MTSPGLSQLKRVIVRTTMVMLTHKMDVLLLFHDKCHSWMGPGGKLESDELVWEGAHRELREEAGITWGVCHDDLPSYPEGNDRVRLCPRTFRILTYVGRVGEESYDLLEDHIFWEEATEDMRYEVLNPPEGHAIGWFDLPSVLADKSMVIQPEVRKTLMEIYSQKLARRAQLSLT